MILPPPLPTLFPYTTLFRSHHPGLRDRASLQGGGGNRADAGRLDAHRLCRRKSARPRWRETVLRSEEHTSELQSRQYLVCRLLLEKRNLLGSRIGFVC